MAGRRRRRQGVAAIAAVTAVLLFAATAQAAEVEVSESDEADIAGFAPAVLHYDAEPGEANHLTVSVVSEADGFFQLELIDTGAAIQPGPGCTGGGAVGVAASCRLRMPLAPEVKMCARPCGPLVARIGWETTFRVTLGNGGSYFDAASIPDASAATYGNGGPAQTVRMEVSGGSGDDRISTAGGNDVIDPGTGADRVIAHAGDDEVKATAEPDGTDAYDLGAATEKNAIDYGLRSGPISYDARAELGGAAGENDRISGASVIVGGAGDDTIVGYRANESFSGGAGNDLLVGKQGRDVLDGGTGDNRLDGGEGGDRLEAGDGADLAEGGYDADYIWLAGGDDVAEGNQGDDHLRLGPGDDRGAGNLGSDVVYGDEGADTILGGYAANWLIGGLGPDKIVTGSDEDTILAGTDTAFVNEPDAPDYRNPKGWLDSWRDTIICGGRAAKVSLNPWDDARRCRRTALIRAVELGRLLPASTTGTATLEVGVRGPGKLKLYGPEVATVRAQPERAARRGNGDPLRMPIRVRGRALREVRRGHEVHLRVTLRYQPKGGLPRTRKATLRLRPREG